MINASNYNITVRKGWFDSEQCVEARVAEYADSFEEAYALAIDTIEVTAEMLAAQGKVMPSPMIPAEFDIIAKSSGGIGSIASQSGRTRLRGRSSKKTDPVAAQRHRSRMHGVAAHRAKRLSQGDAGLLGECVFGDSHCRARSLARQSCQTLGQL